MKYLLTIILFAVGPFTDLDRIATINKLKKEAKQAYTNGNYQKALNNYKYLVDSMEVVDESISLNIANAYYKLNDSTNAINKYHQLADSKNNNIRSVAQQQLGVIANKSKKYKEALEHFKEALKADPSNEDARYNYELLKKILKEQEKQQDPEDQQQKQDQEKKEQEEKDQESKEKSDKSENKEGESEEKPEDGENKEEQEGEEKEQEGKEEEQKDKKDGEKKDEEGKDKKEEPQEGEESEEPTESKDNQMNSLSDKLQDMNISEEKAKMILEALKNREIQYYQQKKRGATKRNDPDKPDW